ncbi:MAG: pneumococcal-type histidine triad protein, partial [Aerococcus sp.]|nr:pneumococcal-type histidine triad protein [Aerococcus sp.]
PDKNNQPDQDEKPTPDKDDQPDQDEKPTPDKDNKPDQEKEPDAKPNKPNHKGHLDLATLKAFPKTAKGKDGKPYTTSDGYTFNVESVMEVAANGVVAKHEEHTHYIPFGDLDDSELEALVKYVNDDKNEVIDGSQTEFSKADIQKKLRYISYESGTHISKLQQDGNQVIIPHGNHFHTKDLRDIPSVIRKSDAAHLEEISGMSYTDMIAAMKMNYMKAYRGASQVIRHGAMLYVTINGQQQTMALKDITLEGLDYEEPDFGPVSDQKDENKSEAKVDDQSENKATVKVDSQKTEKETAKPASSEAKAPEKATDDKEDTEASESAQAEDDKQENKDAKTSSDSKTDDEEVVPTTDDE